MVSFMASVSWLRIDPGSGRLAVSRTVPACHFRDRRLAPGGAFKRAKETITQNRGNDNVAFGATVRHRASSTHLALGVGAASENFSPGAGN
jgi:hypothetical protein